MSRSSNHRFIYNKLFESLNCPICTSFDVRAVNSQWRQNNAVEEWLTYASWNECSECGHFWDFQTRNDPGNSAMSDG